MSGGSQRSVGSTLQVQLNLDDVNRELHGQSVSHILEWAIRTFYPEVVMATGFGPSGVVLIHHIAMMPVPVSLFYLDTDLLFPSTYDLREYLTQRFGVEFQRVHSDISLDEQAHEYGDALWERDPDRCCGIRKVTPLKEFLKDKSAWVTGLRRDQSSQRAGTRIVEWDGRNNVYKVNPLAEWSASRVWNHIVNYGLPYNELHDHGFPSIGCKPCTRRVTSGRTEREGRWPGMDKTECGIHERHEAA